ncbi:hypothetical protein [Maliponia aquimaris]|uniref:Uncharacterized protein n=1 Tax=Maliponia aquimaris TaxID=1673631 RepID=A0A238KZC2_9RHOB|nr:hypothetical protein [Maliponia aquimaris]SMX48153.1 hypothetical protein MAA8898_03881 [Maliponia aquimaris]
MDDGTARCQPWRQVRPEQAESTGDDATPGKGRDRRRAAPPRCQRPAAGAIKGATPAVALYQRVEARFGAPSRDEALLVAAEDFGDPETFAALENLVLGVQLTEDVRGGHSLLVLPDPAGEALS